DGLCIPDPCHDVVCTAGETCEAGVCKPNPCANLGCGARQVCHGGACVDDPCNEVQCPVGTCVNGQCYGGLLPADGGTDGADGGTGGGEDAGTGGEDGADAGAPNAPVDEGPLAPAAPPATGCGCAASSGGDGAALLGALFAVAALRRRRVGAAAAAALLASCAADLPPSQLSGEGGYCEYQSECSPGLTCRGNVCRAPRADAGPVEEPDWLVDNRPKCERCGGEECVDLLVNPAHCGACGTVCGASEKCVDGHCGPADFIGPALSAVAPGTVSQAPQVALQLTGERFKQGAKLHLAGRGLSDLPTQFVSSSRLDVTLDLSDVAPGVMELRVVNPDRVISNASTLEITAATPRITSLSPAQGVTGSSVKVRVQGSGFIRQSLCKVSGAKLPEQGLPTQYQSPSALDCTFDLSGVQPGAYDITVVNAGTLRSNASTFTVISADPVLTTISPGSGKPGAKLSVTATGTGFDATSVLRFNGSPLPTTLVSGTQLFATPLDLTNVAPGNYPVTVANGSKLSNAVTFAVGSNPAELTSISPTHAIQGQSVALTVIGRGFESGSRIQVFDPGGASTLLTTTFVSATELRGTYALGSRPAGTYLVQVQNPGNLASNALPLQVASNVAVLSSLTPAGAAQGANVTLEVSGSNFLSGARIWIGGNGRTNSALTTTVVSSGLVRASNVSLAGWNTGTYSVTVVNTGAQPSNAAGFTVFAGAPTISSLNPSSATQGQVVTVTINGTNFARPDSGGAGGSEVHAAAPSLGLTDSTV
ncbi:MAG: IPT/TIG domain-containing protein, partial [Myxococcales bacterium]